MRDDPLEDARTHCRCEGRIWIPVPEFYVERRARERAAGAHLVGSESSDRNSVYPCARHAPELHARWEGGHLEPDHEWWACDECNPRPIRKQRGRRKASVGPVGIDFSVPAGDRE